MFGTETCDFVADEALQILGGYGFTADYAGGELTVDTRELADARWFRRDALPELPPKRSIARYLLDTVLQLQ